jgi:hypothetical protein
VLSEILDPLISAKIIVADLQMSHQLKEILNSIDQYFVED